MYANFIERWPFGPLQRSRMFSCSLSTFSIDSMLALSNRRSVGNSFDVWILAVPHILSMDVIAFPYAQIVENYIDG